MNILVLYGGDGPEREVSLRSGAAIISALSLTVHTVSEYDPKNGLESLATICEGIDLVLPILHGKKGEDGSLQRQLESVGVEYLGADSVGSEQAFYKDKAHEILEKCGVSMAAFGVVDSGSYLGHPLFKKPFVLKPIDGGSSIDTLIARDALDTKLEVASKLLEKHDTMIVEELVEGLEITIPVLGTEALDPIAIVAPEGKEFDYENKYNGSTQEICPIPSEMLSLQQQENAKKIALKAHEALKIRHLSRTDMIIKEDGSIVVLELNTMPGMTDQSLFPRSAKASGLSMVGMVEKFISIASSSK
ncbi:MAG: D-alanine-D-alanine ligase [Candidatus Saccharimonadales bacterium]|jgi:D-alanine-D-alanine ligase